MARKRKSVTGGEESGAAAAAAAGGKEVPSASAWKGGLDFVGMLATALALAFLIKGYVVDVYLVPSGSMETALHGRPDGGDRIFCSKFHYRFNEPRRWEVAVFDFPYESARANDPRHASPEYEGQNFVKRIVGLPGETMAIGRGDIWTRPFADGQGPFRRAVKSDSVQRGMWLAVYEEDFADRSEAELARFWRVMGNIALERGGSLRLAAGAGDGEGVRLDYRPLVPAGTGEMVELPGVPDRYVLRQAVQFRCNAPVAGDANNKKCGKVFVRTFQTQNIEARCPACGALLSETAAIFYHRRSGLAATGRYAVPPSAVPQGEDSVPPRRQDYHFVPDLRVVTDLALFSGAAFTVTLREDGRFVQAVVSSDGHAEIRVNGAAPAAGATATAPIRPGAAHRLEFYVVDGTARLFVDSETAILDVPVWAADRRPMPRQLPRESGVGLAAAGGEVEVRRIQLDRDVFYYSGHEQEGGERYASMNSRGEIGIPMDAFLPMGDHCTSSYDARSWGPVPVDMLSGRALAVFWPPERAGFIPAP